MGYQKGPVGATLDFVFPVPGCPPMRPEPSFIVFVSFYFPLDFPPCNFLLCLTIFHAGWHQPRHLVLTEYLVPLQTATERIANRAVNEAQKKAKEDRRKKERRK